MNKELKCELFETVNESSNQAIESAEIEVQKKLDCNSCILSFVAGIGCAAVIAWLDTLIQALN